MTEPEVKVLMLKGAKGDGLSDSDMQKVSALISSSVANAEENISNSLNSRLANARYVPEIFANADDLKAAYPNGKDGIFVVADTGHMWLFVNGNWADAGTYQSTTSLEVENARAWAGWFGDVQSSSIGEAIRGQFEKLGYFANLGQIICSTTSEKEETLALKEPVAIGSELEFAIANLSQQDGYFGIILNGTEESKEVSGFGLIAPSETKTFKATAPFEVVSIILKNTNSRKAQFIGKNNSLTVDSSQAYFEKIDKHLGAKDYGVYAKVGYLDASGALHFSSDEKQKVTPKIPVHEGDVFYFTGSYAGWGVLFGYNSDGTAVELVQRGTYIGRTVTIPDGISQIRGWTSNGDLKLQYAPDNANKVDITTLDNASLALMNSNGTVEKQSNGSIIYTVKATGNGGVRLKRTVLAKKGDKLLIRAKLTSSRDCTIQLVAFEDTAQYYSKKSRLTANDPKELYFAVDLKEAHENIIYQISVESYEVGTNVEVDYFGAVVDSLQVWSDEESKRTLKDMGQLPITVSQSDPNAMFDDINWAIDFAKTMYDVQNVPVTIFIGNGTYNLTFDNFAYDSAIDKGSNRISLIGESRDGVKLSLVNTSDKQGKVLNIGGPCTVANMSIYSLHDDTYTGNTLVKNPYCIHNDTFFDSDEPYLTVVENCYLYSACHAPIGGGLRNNQTQIYRNTTLVMEGNDGDCFYVHAPANATEKNCAVVADGITAIAKNGRRAISFANVNGSIPYTEIPVTIRRSIFVSNGEVGDQDFKKAHNLTSDSALNNRSELNF